MIDTLRESATSWHQAAVNAERKWNRLVLAHAAAARQVASENRLAVCYIGKKKRFVAFSGCIALAIRRNASNVATADMGSVCTMHLGRKQVTRAEVIAAAALLAWSECAALPC